MDRRPAAVLFVDVCGSTAYFDRHGEIAGREMVERCLRFVIPEIELRRGRVVKTLGDGLLAVFDRAEDMVAGASAAHTALYDANEALPADERIRIHTGGHFGPAVFDETGDVFGDVVNVAARVQGIAGPDQIFVTDDVLQLIQAEAPSVRRIGSFPLRGKESDTVLHEVLWRVDSHTMLFSAREILKEVGRLTMTVGTTTTEFGPDKSKMSIGRVPSNDVVVDDSAVSREHAEVVRRRGFFYFVDRSTNGTYIRPASGNPRHLHREELHLEGSGSISLGRPDGPPILYKVNSA